MKPFLVVYLDDDNNLHTAEFQTETAAHTAMEDKCCKFVVVHGNIASVDTEYSCWNIVEITKQLGGGESWYYLLDDKGFQLDCCHEDDKEGMKRLYEKQSLDKPRKPG